MMPSSKATATTDYAASNLNPYGNAAVAGNQVVHIAMTFENVSPDLDGQGHERPGLGRERSRHHASARHRRERGRARHVKGP
jgi:hypothetical protein